MAVPVSRMICGSGQRQPVDARPTRTPTLDIQRSTERRGADDRLVDKLDGVSAERVYSKRKADVERARTGGVPGFEGASG